MTDTDLMAVEAESLPPSDANLAFHTKKFILQSLLEKAAVVLPTKDVVPVLKNFQIEAVRHTDPLGYRLRVTATDLELTVVASSEMVVVDRPGAAVFPARKLMDIMREGEDGEVSIDVADGLASIRVGDFSASLRLMDGSDFPPRPDAGREYHRVDRERFLDAITAVRYAAASEITRQNLMVVDVVGGRVTACDGAKLQQAVVEGFPLDIQIPIRAVDDLIKLLRSVDLPEISVGETDHQLIFYVGADLFVANKMMSEFPDVEAQVLRPALTNKEHLTVDRADLVAAVRRVRITADAETSAVLLTVGANQLTVASRDKRGNTSSETIPAGWSGEPRSLVVNHAFLLEMLASNDVKSCDFLLGTDTRSRKTPLLLRDEASGRVGILNQMRPDWAGYEAEVEGTPATTDAV